MSFSDAMYYLIAVLSLANFIRIFVMILGADIYDMCSLRTSYQERHKRKSRRLVTVVIPAYNEETGVVRTVESVLQNSYKKVQVVVVDDGSTDGTLAKLRNFQRKNKGKITIVSQQNAGKAAAINRAVRFWAKGSLVMVVDADSLLHPKAIEMMVRKFSNPRTIAVAANVKIIPTRSMLGMAQRFEYLISYRMKRALATYGAEYIVGGVGSTFRKSAIMDCGLYDTDTMTEDIDLTVKLIRRYGNKKGQIGYAADAIAYTEHVIRFSSLVKQRFRWKYGRMQTLSKNRALFFNKQKRYSKLLTWYQLPHALFGELALLLEPLLVGFVLAAVVVYGDVFSLLWVYGIVTSFVFLVLLGEPTESRRMKISLALGLPLVYILMYVLTVVEFAALFKSLIQVKSLHDSSIEHGSWQHVERHSGPVSIITK